MFASVIEPARKRSFALKKADFAMGNLPWSERERESYSGGLTLDRSVIPCKLFFHLSCAPLGAGPHRANT